MSEEVRKAKQAVPRAIFWTRVLGGNHMRKKLFVAFS
jgi:hypothetical protein